MHASLPLIEIAIPVHTAAAHLKRNIETIRAYLRVALPCHWRITITDNASTNHTWMIARHLAAVSSAVQAVHLEEHGRRRALQQT